MRLDFAHPDRFFGPETVAQLWRVRQVRRSVATFAGATAFVLALWGTEAYRLHRAEAQLLDLRSRFETLTIARARTEGVLRSLGSLNELDRRVADVRGSGFRQVATIVAIGNALPKDVYVDSVRPGKDLVQVSGHAGSMDDLGRAVLALQGTDGAQPSVRSATRIGDQVRYEIELRTEASPSPLPIPEVKR